MKFLPFFILTWVIMNVGSTINPFKLSPGFFRWGYALPAHETYQVFVQIWSDGCNGQLYRALPILFGEWVIGIGVVIFSVRYRCKTAMAAEQASMHTKDTEVKDSASRSEINSNRGRGSWRQLKVSRVNDVILRNLFNYIVLHMGQAIRLPWYIGTSAESFPFPVVTYSILIL